MLRKFFKKNSILVIGDSHSRAFSKNKNFFPVFIGPGKEINFTKETNLNNIFDKTNSVLSKASNKYVMFTLGEPDARYLLGMGWYPWDGKVEFELKDFRPHVDISVDRYIGFLIKIKEHYPSHKFFVLNVTPTQRIKQNEITEYYNKMLSYKLLKTDIKFIDVNKSIIKKNLSINEDFLGDSVHLNNKIQPLVEDYFVRNNIIKKSLYNNKLNWKHLELKNNFSYSEKFGCYIEKK